MNFEQVTPVLALSPALALAGEDSDEECQAPVDTLIIHQAQEVCSAALRVAGSIPRDTSKEVIRWLQQHNLLEILADGEMVLTREAVTHGVCVSGDVLESSLRTERTTLEVQAGLSHQGWRFVADFRQASIQSKVAAEGNPNGYYELLVHFPENVAAYEESEEHGFNHKQSESYYQAVMTAIIAHPEVLQDVPPYKPVSFYTMLQQHFLDDSCPDPRLEIERKRQRTRIG